MLGLLHNIDNNGGYIVPYEDFQVCTVSGLHADQAHGRVLIVARRRKDARDSVSVSLECSILISPPGARRPG